MKNAVQKGDYINVTTVGAVVAGQIGVHGSYVGVYANDSAAGESNVLAVEEVYNLTKKDPTEVLTVGMPLYKVGGEGSVRNAGVAGDIFIGLVAKDSGNGVLTVDCDLERSFSVALT